MKQLTCEMCGSTELVKQEGFFVCQTCGCKYSVEEAKKMMIEGTVEVQGAVNVQNAAQLESLLKLAHSSFDSKNYAQAEEFCNQVISMDSLNYEAWKLKGEAINYQISAKNPRILEVYNCIMTSYRVLSDDAKEEKKEEILDSIRTCLEGEIDFWLEQFEAQRPTDAMLNKVKSTFLDCATKVADSFAELGYSAKDISDYVNYIQAYFVKKANRTCLDTWKSTVYYNYYRKGFNDDYHPSKEILTTYIDEADNLIALLEFCIKQFSDDVPVTLRAAVYENIIFYHNKLCEAQSYKRMVSTTTNGYGAVTNRREYWEKDTCLTEAAKANRRKTIAEYKKKVENEFEEDSKKRDVPELLKLAKKDLGDDEPTYALYRYNAAIKKDAACSIAYLGKAVAIGGSGGSEAEIVKNIIFSSKYEIKADDQQYVAYLINFKCGESKVPLLAYAAANVSYDAAEYLIKLGADVNAKTKHNVTPLWYLSYKALDTDKVNDGRRIAKLLIDKGASFDVKAENGIDLYNNHTDSEIARMIQEKNPTIEKGSSKKAGGCYVATCVYGSYDCPQVWTLRRYRDDTLGSTWYGRLFIRTYYAISPTLVKWFGKTNWFKKLWKGKLDRMVAKLQNNGVEDTPYEDKEW